MAICGFDFGDWGRGCANQSVGWMGRIFYPVCKTHFWVIFGVFVSFSRNDKMCFVHGKMRPAMREREGGREKERKKNRAHAHRSNLTSSPVNPEAF